MSIRVSRSALRRVLVAIDPAVTSGEESDETGIIVAARGPHQPETCKLERCPGHGYVLADESCRVRPQEWARRAIAAYDHWQADGIVAEVNNGGEMVGETIHAVRLGIPYKPVTATRGKRTRAAPVAALWEQGRVHLIGSFPQLEDQLRTWTEDQPNSPDRLDACVWACTALGLIGAQGQAFMAVYADEVQVSKDAAPRIPRSVHLEGYSPPVLDARCKHRFFDDGLCVHCGGPDPKGA